MTEPISVTDGVVSLRDGSSSWARIIVRGQAAGTVSIDAGPNGPGAGAAAVTWQLMNDPAGEHAFRVVQLVLHHLATRTTVHTACVQLADREERSRAVASQAGFTDAGRIGQRWLRRAVPPVTYTDGVVSIRRQRVEDIDAHLAGIDDAEIDWLWEPGSRSLWEAMTPEEQRARNLAYLRGVHDSFGSGPKWTFSADGADADYIAYVDCDLANNHVPAGQANVSYTCHPPYRGHGNVSRAVRLITRFLGEHTGVAEAHIIVDEQNAASLRVAHAVGAAETERFRNEHGRTMIRHVLLVR